MSTVLSEVPPTLDRMLSVREVAGVLGLRHETVYRMMSAGTMPSKKIGGSRRIWMSELHEWVSAQ